MKNFGPNVQPLEGQALAVLSTGTARLPGQSGYLSNHQAGHQCTAPAGWPKTNPLCTNDSKVAYDSITFKLKIRTPTNALGFSTGLNFFTLEFAEYVCGYNDSFVIFYNRSGATKNIGIDKQGYSVNSNNPILRVCTPQYIEDKVIKGIFSQDYPCPLGRSQLLGNGFDVLGDQDGGATGWLFARGAFKPGETIELEFSLWDVGDDSVTSSIVLDKFRWHDRISDGGLTEDPCAPE